MATDVRHKPLRTHATLVALIEFPSLAEFDGFASDSEYAPFADARRRGSVSRFHVVDATDVAGAIAYLRKG